jgi:GNAT superfamily N-acetyltransferase
MEIRKAEVKDLEKLVEFQLAMALETENLKLEREIVHKGIAHLFYNPNLGDYWGAYHENELAACTLTIPEWSDWRNGTVLWIHSVYVKPEHRSGGVFKEIYNFLKKKVENEEKYMGLRLYVDKKNVNAQKVYAKLGMNGEHYQLFEWMKK